MSRTCRHREELQDNLKGTPQHPSITTSVSELGLDSLNGIRSTDETHDETEANLKLRVREGESMRQDLPCTDSRPL